VLIDTPPERSPGSKRYARLVNANPMTGAPAVLGEVAEMLQDLTPSSAPSRSVRTLPLSSRPQGVLQEVIADVARRRAPTCLLVRFDQEGWEVLRDEQLDLPPRALLRYLHELWKDGRLSDEEFLRGVPAEILSLPRARVDRRRSAHLTQVTRGSPINGAVGKGILLPGDSVDPRSRSRHDRYLALVDRVDARHTRLLSDPDCQGVLALRGSRADHFALLAQERQFPYMILDSHHVTAQGLKVGARLVPFGTFLTVNFCSGEVYAGDGAVEVLDEGPEVRTVRALLAARASPVPLRLNVDAVEDLCGAFPPEASGIGLLRTEHLLRHGRQEELLCRLLTAEGEQVDPGARAQLRAFFAQEFAGFLRFAQGRPVTVRLLDFPLHELHHRTGEVNPMLGLRGMRQGVRWPHLYHVQIEALLEATVAVSASGSPVAAVELSVPLVVLVEEVDLVHSWVAQARHVVAGSADLVVNVGAMVETPAAVLAAHHLAHRCDFLSFGTNDLTQLALGLSREDYPAVLQAYRRRGLLTADPFETLHPIVATMVHEAAQRARRTNPDVIISLCGAHASDPFTSQLYADGLIDYVSVPIERLSHAKLRVLAAAYAWERAQ
jgi:pyruvate, orthophosphate dikinase